MIRLFVDINVILDVLLLREPHWEASQKILSAIEQKTAIGYTSALTYSILHYLVRKKSGPEKALRCVQDLLKVFHTVEVNQKTIERALGLEAKDFEDGLQMACAERCEADYIITRNGKDFSKSNVPPISPSEYLAK